MLGMDAMSPPELNPPLAQTAQLLNKVEIWTDHKNLEYFMTAKKLNCRQACWLLHLSRFDFVLRHQPGKSMGKCDALLCHIDHNPGLDDICDITLLKPKFFTAHALEGMTVEGAEWDILQEIRRGVQDGKGDEVVLAMKEFNELKGKTLRSAEWSNVDGLWRFCDHIYVPLITDLHCWITQQHCDSHIAGPAGQWKMLKLLM
jgi:RNase H-like domain found in reverse transcriptase